MRRFGVLIVSVLALPLAGCLYSFTGGGLPAHIRTVAINTFDNQTPSPDIPKELLDSLHKELQRRLGVRDAPIDHADALVRGTITTYDADVPVAFNASPQSLGAGRKLQITVEVEIIDQSNNHVLYTNKALRAEADYAERDETTGRQKAISKIVQQIIEGVQSNW
jgi:hypothetical protein